jgi:hypothetical protein
MAAIELAQEPLARLELTAIPLHRKIARHHHKLRPELIGLLYGGGQQIGTEESLSDVQVGIWTILTTRKYHPPLIRRVTAEIGHEQRRSRTGQLPRPVAAIALRETQQLRMLVPGVVAADRLRGSG